MLRTLSGLVIFFPSAISVCLIKDNTSSHSLALLIHLPELFAMWQQNRPKRGYLSVPWELRIRTSAAAQPGTYSSTAWELSSTIVSSVTEIKAAAGLNSQGGH